MTHTAEHSGFEVFSMDANDPMYLIPKPVIFMLDETVSPPQWIQDDVKIFQETCERVSDDHAICDISAIKGGGVSSSKSVGRSTCERHSPFFAIT